MSTSYRKEYYTINSILCPSTWNYDLRSPMCITVLEGVMRWTAQSSGDIISLILFPNPFPFPFTSDTKFDVTNALCILMGKG